MVYFNRHFWKFVAGFLGILALALLMLFGFEYYKNYKQEQEMKTFINELRKEGTSSPPFENPLRSFP
jgi:hypothetical protein